MRKAILLLAWLVLAACRLVPLPVAQAEEDTAPSLLPGMQMEWGGYVRAIGTVSTVDADSLFASVNDDPYLDGQAEWRQKNRIIFGSHWRLDTHYELVASGGDTWQTTRTLMAELPASPSSSIFFNQPVNDDRRLMDLTHTLSETDRFRIYHRLDRLNLTWTPDWGTVRLGRQALTWGDGLVFNPMDLFNPFAPATVQRDYKTGDDMALVQLPIGQSDIQLLYLPRRDPLTGDVETEASSFAANFHTFAGSLELGAMAARHFDDTVGGLGASGTFGEAVWRINTIYTHLAEALQQSDFLQLVANLDYAWMWGGKNIYGLLEFYYNGLGRADHYQLALHDQALMQRIVRGEMFTLGRLYLAGQIQAELHPLVQLHATAIVNLADPSGLLQPQVLWDMAGNWQLIAGVQWHWGKKDTEFGGFPVDADGLAFTAAPSDQAYLWLTRYF